MAYQRIPYMMEDDVVQREREEAEKQAREAERRREEDARRAERCSREEARLTAQAAADKAAEDEAAAEEARRAEEAEEARLAEQPAEEEAAAEETRRAADAEEAQAAAEKAAAEAPLPVPPVDDDLVEPPQKVRPERDEARRKGARTAPPPKRGAKKKNAARPKSRTEKIGRREPPEQTRFKPGQSGNPSGRPKGSRNKVTRGNLARALIDEAERTSEQSGLSVHKQVVRALVDKATAGSVPALRLYMTWTADAEAQVADLDDAAGAKEQEARDKADRRAVQDAEDERRRAEAADDYELARRLAAEDPDLYRRARALSPLDSDDSRASSQPKKKLRFTEAVERACLNRAVGCGPWDRIDPYVAMAAAARMEEQVEEDEDDERGEEDEEEESDPPAQDEGGEDA